MMLFYNQTKRVFSPACWKTGQTYFREERVKNVRLSGRAGKDGGLVTAKVDTIEGQVYDIQLHIQRGSIVRSSCNCPSHQVLEAHCKHVAALSVWLIERGSLLRAGVGDKEDGLAEYSENDEEVAEIVLPTEKNTVTLPAEAVIFVRGLFQTKVLQAISVEPAIRYRDPTTKLERVEMIAHLVRQPQANKKESDVSQIWRTADGYYLKVMHTIVPILQTLESARILYQGSNCLDHLAKLLGSPYQSQMVFHQNLPSKLEKEPLRLISMSVGKKIDKTRVVSYQFKSSTFEIDSTELSKLSTQGRVSSSFVWNENILYRFETSLVALAKYANRTGLSTQETHARNLFVTDGHIYLDDEETNPLHPLTVYRLSLELGVEQFSVDTDWKEFHEWKKNFEKKKIPALPNVEYGFELRDYQQNGLHWIWSLYHRGLSALLADDMGLGKTHQVLAFLTSIYNVRNRPKAPCLVIAPTSVVAAWTQKLQKYPTGLRWNVFHGKSRSLSNQKVDLVLTTYGILQKEPLLRTKEWHVVVLDEAQAVKNSSTISARASRVLKSKFRIAMTGTPIENQSTDLWSIMEVMLPGYLGTLPRFKRLYGSGRDKPSAYQANALKRLISPFLLRRTKSQVLKELPEKTEEVISCEMTAVQKKAYRNFLSGGDAQKVRDNLKEGGKIDYASILALLTRLKQVCDHPKLPSYTSGKLKKIKSLIPQDTGKWETFEELVQEALGSNLKVVVFTQYLGMIDLIAHWLKSQNVGYVELRGDTTDRAARLDRFAADPECKVFVCSLLAGGLGIDLTAASVCIHFDRWWNPAKENQATDRLHRIGQTRGVQVFKLQIPGTIEDRIASIIESKIALSGTLIEESPVGLKAFSRVELLELLTVKNDEKLENENSTEI